MYCYKCGTQLIDGANFCSVCGADQRVRTAGNSTAAHSTAAQPQSHQPPKPQAAPAPRKKGGLRRVLVSLAVFLVVYGAAYGLGQNLGSQQSGQSKSGSSQIPYQSGEDSAQIWQGSQKDSPADGWYEENGSRCYYRSGAKLTGKQTVNGSQYFFDEITGALKTSTTVTYDGNEYTLDASGGVTAVTYGYVDSDWAAEKYYFGNGGSSSVMQLSQQLTRCTSFILHLEAEGLYGSNVTGSWRVKVRSGGSWEEVGTVSYGGGESETRITFDTPTTFDAVTAYPTKQGNASYSSLFYVIDAKCKP